MILKTLGIQPYEAVWQAMQAKVQNWEKSNPDEFWLLQHEPVYTLGQAGKPEHILKSSAIPVVRTDRGGQVTYHGPGQWVGYLLIDLERKGLGARSLVQAIENLLITLLSQYKVQARADKDAPGVYVENAKIASLGFRIRRGISYHGFALNVDMDLSPFKDINPCGYAGMPITQLSEQSQELVSMETVKQRLIEVFSEQVGPLYG